MMVASLDYAALIALENYTTVNYVQGCDIDSTDKSGFSEAIKAA
jgi:hypothetical protein